MSLGNVVNFLQCPIESESFRRQCKSTLDKNGVLVLRDFLTSGAVSSIRAEGDSQRHLAFYTVSNHNIYLRPMDPEFPLNHPRNREVVSTKGCITTDQIPDGSALRLLYNAPEFQAFLCSVLGEPALYEYTDPLSSINLHYADEGQELGWHFDNSSFAITLMIQEPESGGVFEYVKDVRDADRGEMNFDAAEAVLDGNVSVSKLSMNAGALVLFRGRNAMHRVTPVEGNRTRMLVVLAYNTKPGISLSESARMTFYGWLG